MDELHRYSMAAEIVDDASLTLPSLSGVSLKTNPSKVGPPFTAVPTGSSWSMTKLVNGLKPVVLSEKLNCVLSFQVPFASGVSSNTGRSHPRHHFGRRRSTSVHFRPHTSRPKRLPAWSNTSPPKAPGRLCSPP